MTRRHDGMAVEYRLYGAADLETDQLVSFLAAELGGTVGDDGRVRRDGLDVTPYRVETGDEAWVATSVFGFPHRVTASFRLSNRVSEQVRELNVGLMMRAVLSFFDTYPGDGVLLFNGEEVVLQKLTGQVSVNSDWEDWTELAGLRMLRAGRDFRPLPQPLL
ncbi:hypothetical protein EF879_05220 [Micromonospora sp. HM5-17]|nr:hypothetical protein EF879_05220 [Micromonospora sp. HM5-17]